MSIVWTDNDMRLLAQVASIVEANPASLLACMYFESRLDPQAVNSTSGAYGLIQWTPPAYSISGIGSRSQIPPTVSGQLPLVANYLAHFKVNNGAVYQYAGDIYQAIFAPGYFPARNMDLVYYRSPSDAYDQNRSLDSAHKGYITKGDTVRQVYNATKDYDFQVALVHLQTANNYGWVPDFGPDLPTFSQVNKNGEPVVFSPSSSFASFVVPLALAGAAWYYRKPLVRQLKKYARKWR